MKHITAILREDADIEHVHQARVASRRLNAAFTLFDDKFEKKELSRWKKRVKKLMKSLSPARDKDVLIEALEQRMENLAPEQQDCRAGIRRMMLRMTQQRNNMNKDIHKAIRRIEKSQVISEIGAAVSRNIWHHRLNPEVDEYMQTEDIHNCSVRIREKLAQLVSMETCLEDPQNAEGHHKMRIAAKKLRYTMEICREPFDSKLDSFIKKCKKVQNLAGEIHDCDVWAQIINQFEENEHKRAVEFYGTDRQHKRLEPGINYLLEFYARRRAEKFDSLVQYWNDLRQDCIWEKLIELLKTEEVQAEQQPAAESSAVGRDEAKSGDGGILSKSDNHQQTQNPVSRHRIEEVGARTAQQPQEEPEQEAHLGG